MDSEAALLRLLEQAFWPVIAAALACFCVAALLAHAHLRARRLLELHTEVCALLLKHEARKADVFLSSLKAEKYRKLERHLRKLLKEEGLVFAAPPPPAPPPPTPAAP